jgi:DHA2 family multidrug resistance protein
MHEQSINTRPNKWIIAITVMFGAFMAVMDISVVNVALPHMMGSFGQDISAITWIATSYSIAEVIMVTMAGWLSTVLGRKRLYLFSFGIFTIGSILCGTAQTYTQMLIYRTFQGIGGGALIPVSQAILRETFPPQEQGMAMGIFGMGVVLAPALGPVLGGWLTDSYGWPWIFYINIPVSIVGILMVWTFVNDPAYLRRGIHKIDWQGIVLMTITLTTMQIVLERGQSENWFESSLIVTGSLICVAVMIALVFWEMKSSEPVINFRLLRNIPLSVGSSMGIVFGISLFGTTFILPQFTQELLGYSAFDAGLVLAPRAFVLVLCMPLAGWLYRRVDPRWLVFAGILIIYWSYYDLAHLSLEAGFWNLAPMLIIMGAGMPLMFVTTSTVSLSSIPPADMTDAASLYTLSRRIGGNIGYALVATLVSRGIQTHRTYLSGNINSFNNNYTQFQEVAASKLLHSGVNPVAIKNVVISLVSVMLNRQATMLAYNDVSRILGFLFLFTVPLVLLLPSRKKIKEMESGTGKN